MEFATHHHETLAHGGINRSDVPAQAPLLSDTMRKIVNAILEGKPHVQLSTYNKKKGRESKKEKKFPLPNIEGLPHKDRKHIAKEVFHEALAFRSIDLNRNRITLACRQIQAEYKVESIFPEKKLWKDAKTLVGAYFLFRKTDGNKGLLSTVKTLTKHPSTGAFDGSTILSTLKTVLQSVEGNKDIDYKEFTKKLERYILKLLSAYPDTKDKK